MPGLLTSPEAYRGTILERSGGQLPPYCICVGDRRRARKALQLLDEGSMTDLEDKLTKLGGNIGRVCVGVGAYKGTPVAIFEHQMGGSPVEIILTEMLSHQVMTREFHYNGKTFNAPQKIALRVGSCGGINKYDMSNDPGREINPFDLIVASHQLGVQSADVQALTGIANPCDPRLPALMREHLGAMGWKYKDDWPVCEANKELADLLVDHANKQLGDLSESKAIKCGNVSKDSLYSEANEDSFVQLREKYPMNTI